jgi:hypothetical protein
MPWQPRLPRPLDEWILEALARPARGYPAGKPETRGGLRMYPGFSKYPAGAIQAALDRLEAAGRIRRVPAVHRRRRNGDPSSVRTWEGVEPAYELVESPIETNGPRGP